MKPLMLKKHRKEMERLKGDLMDMILSESHPLYICILKDHLPLPLHHVITFLMFERVPKSGVYKLDITSQYTVYFFGRFKVRVPGVLEDLTPIETMEFIKEHLE